MNTIMKSILIFNLFFLLLVINACRKEDNPKLPHLIKLPTPLVQKLPTGNQVIDATNPTAFSGSFTVGFYFEGHQAQKLDAVVMKNGNTGNVKTLQSNVTSFPSTLTVTGSQLTSLFGSPIVLGDKFDIGVNITTLDGTTYEAFPSSGAAYASGVAAQPGASTFIRYQAVCQYDPNKYQGKFVVVTDEWADYNSGDVIDLIKIDNTHFSFKYAANNAKPIIVTVNAITNSVSVAKQVYGDYGPPYGDFSAQSVPGVDNFVAPCDGTFSIVLEHSAAVGSFGTYKLVLKKQ
jgi:hypothetical protein